MILEQGKLNIGAIDSCSWGSGGKGKIADYIAANEPLDFAIAHNSHNASHVTVFDDGSSYKFNCLPSAVSNPKVKVVLGPDSAVQLPKLFEEINDWNLTEKNLFIHPNMAIITEEHVKIEEKTLGDIGSTMSGVGAAKASKIMRKGFLTADQVPELSKYIANTPKLIIDWLNQGQTGLLETAQGFDLSMDLVYCNPDDTVGKFFPCTTSRNINPSHFLGASFVPYQLAGSVIMNLRTFAIRVGDNSNSKNSKVIKFKNGAETSFSDDTTLRIQLAVGEDEYIAFEDLTNEKINEFGKCYYDNKEISAVVKLGSSGHCYPDQEELTWDQISEIAGRDFKEETSLTKRTRRVFTFSEQQLKNATMSCMPTHFSLNFVNYLDASIEGKSGEYSMSRLVEEHPKVARFVRTVERVQFWGGTEHAGKVCYLGTGAKRSEMIELIC